MNDTNKIGAFIQQLRKEKNMTQKELADQLNITDKAVSKWERGLSCPDISLLIPLAKLLDISTSELLNGEKKSEPLTEETENIVKEALFYSDNKNRSKLANLKKTGLILITTAFFIAAVVCLICDYCISGGLGWSLIVISSLIFSWILLLPFLRTAKNTINTIRLGLIILSLSIIPYLAILGLLLKEGMIFTMGSCLAIISLVGIWCIYAVFFKLSHRKLLAAGFSCLILVPVTILINYTVGLFIRQPAERFADNFINTVSTIALAALCFGLDYIIKQRAK